MSESVPRDPGFAKDRAVRVLFKYHTLGKKAQRGRFYKNLPLWALFYFTGGNYEDYLPRKN